MMCYGSRSREGWIEGINPVFVDSVGTGWADQWWRLHRIVPSQVKRHGINVVFSLSGYVVQRLWRICGTTGTVNNMLPFTPAIARDYGIGLRLKWWLQRWRLVSSLKRTDTVLLHSRHALESVSRYAGNISAKCQVVLSGVPAHSRIDLGHPPGHPYQGRPYFFYLSAIKRYKNHLNLIEGFSRLLVSDPETPDLILAGFPSDKAYLREILGAIESSGFTNRIRYIGAVEESHLQAWLYHAVANVFASTCETNSLVLAEILGASGVLVCSDRPPMPEIVAQAAEFFDPTSPDSISRAISEVWRNPARNQELRRLSAARAGELSWNECGRAIWSLAESALSKYQRRRHAI